MAGTPHRAVVLGLLLMFLAPVNEVFSASSRWSEQAGTMPVVPADGEVVSINPPIFSWNGTTEKAVQFELRKKEGSTVHKASADRNWLLLNETLAPGRYEWRITGSRDSTRKPWSLFEVPPGATEWAVPPASVLLERARAKQRPRSLNPEALRAKAERKASVLGELGRTVRDWSGASPLQESALRFKSSTAGEAQDSQKMAVQKMVFAEEDKILQAALVALSTGGRQALAEARRRALNMANLDPGGATSFAAHDHGGRSVAWTLALVYDWLYPEWTEAERSRLLAAISARLEEMLGKVRHFGLDDGRRLDASPYDSHGAVTLARVSVICTVMAGVSPQFDACFRNTVPRYLMWPVPWGRDDGGYANGTNYAQWDTAYTHFLVWDMLKESIGLDVATMPWAQGYGKFITYFLPPGTPTGLFGDGAEKNWRNTWATQARAYAARVPSPLADWYVRNQFGADETSLPVLLAPYRDWSAVEKSLPVGTPDALHLPSVGWVAMHSSLADRGRTSVYFKSSSYGSFSHSHADQNGFVINAAGQPLAIDSGYYDYYDSPHWRGWYKQTRAHNAVTFDGGQGQLHDTMVAKGKITQFETTPVFDLVTGEATQAYGGALTRAVRSMVYVRPGTLLVFDSLASGKPRTWEWNIHALNPMAVSGGRSIEIEKDGERLCVEVLHGPEMAFSQTDEFTHAPSGDYRKQWHGAFRSVAKGKDLRMLTMLSVNCDKQPVEVTVDPSGLGVALAGHRFVFTDASVERAR